MAQRRSLTRVSIVLGAALLSLYCSEAAGPDRPVPRPLAQTTPVDGIRLDQFNGTMGGQTDPTLIQKGFNPTNPHVGDAILATFFWFGAPGGNTGNIIDSVTDVLATTPPTKVGNKYQLVEFVSNGTISQATYLATNVQNFPDPNTDPGGSDILVVRAHHKVPVADGGVLLTAWIGVAGVDAQALGEHRSNGGLGMPNLNGSPTTADPGAISLNPGALAYGVSLVSPPSGVVGPAGWTLISSGGDLIMTADGEYNAQFTTSESGGSLDPQWSWFFNTPGSWLATALALNPAATTGDVTVTTTTGENAPTSDFTVTVDGTTSQPIAPTGSVTFAALLPGTHAVALSNVPANCELSGASSVEVTIVAGVTATVAFAVTCSAPVPPPPPPPPPSSRPPNDFVTGGGKLPGGREFATFGIEASPTDGKIQWVQHCPDGANPASPVCALGRFTFHGTVTPGTYAEGSRGPNCRTWSGSGDSEQTGRQNFTVRQGCDGGEPGHGVDYLEVQIGDYQNSGFLTGGNIQLHRSQS